MENKTNHICIIDDDPLFRFSSKKMIEIGSCSNTCFLIFENGLEAYSYFVEALKTNSKLPNLILLDINMPVMDGWEFLEKITLLENSKNLKITVVSSSSGSDDILKAKNYAIVNDYITKPFNMAKIKRILSKLKN
ncbi:response regulator [Mesonia aestuariivivens]|uniref:Response regulator n=1 Tax=Mesonia aestuariivivens TaxID=2796128 RepID=A0ABS6W4V2_9FLAO|nr:response regulator [Mesonia aestuariivivens]MBW2962844.1 response regulator [Mesonia aestuariivivens]